MNVFSHPRCVSAVHPQFENGRLPGALPEEIVQQHIRAVDRLPFEITEDPPAPGGQSSTNAEVEKVQVSVAQKILCLIDNKLIEQPLLAVLPIVEKSVDCSLWEFFLPERWACVAPNIKPTDRQHVGVKRAGPDGWSEIRCSVSEPAPQVTIETDEEGPVTSHTRSSRGFDGEQRLASSCRADEHGSRILAHSFNGDHLIGGIAGEFSLKSVGPRSCVHPRLEIWSQDMHKFATLVRGRAFASQGWFVGTGEKVLTGRGHP